jgi:hypothetical protein
MFDYLTMGFLQITKDKELSTNGYDPANPNILPIAELEEEYYKSIGKNTGYYFHPEEIIAINYGYMAANKTAGHPD